MDKKNKTFYELDKNFLRYKTIENELLDLKNKEKIIELSKEYNSLKKILNDYIKYKELKNELDELNILLNNEKNDDILELISNEVNLIKKNLLDIKNKILNINLNIENKNKNNLNVFFEIRAATGGNESSIFVKDLLKMYSNYFNSKNWKYEIINCSYSNINGYKEVIIIISGNNIYEELKYESGIHRVQRIPSTESSGRIHTSTCTIAVLEEPQDINSINLNQNDLKIDTYRASGAGGQHVNMTDSAVRITHIPTGIVCECQNERSQHKNKNTALKLLKSKILEMKKNEIKNNFDNKRKMLVRSGERSEKIRTYNFTQNRITDHRINFTLYRLNDILNGNIDLLINELKKHEL